MIKDSSKKPYEFENKYFTPLFMDNAIEELFDKDVEILYTSCPVSSAVFFYCDDLTENELIDVYTYMGVIPKIDKIPVLKESDFNNINVNSNDFWKFVSQILGYNSKLFRIVKG